MIRLLLLALVLALSFSPLASDPMPKSKAGQSRDIEDVDKGVSKEIAILNFTSQRTKAFYYNYYNLSKDIARLSVAATIDRIIEINKDLASGKGDKIKLADDKAVLLAALPVKIADIEVPLGFDIQNIVYKKNRLSLNVASDKEQSYKRVLNEIDLNLTLAREVMYITAYNLRSEISFFTSISSFLNILKTNVDYLKTNIYNRDIKIPDNIAQKSKRDLATRVNDLNLTITTYRECLDYISFNVREMLLQNIMINNSIEYILKQINKVIAVNANNLLIIKLILCAIILLVLLSMRKVIARLIYKVSSFFIKKLINKDSHMQKTIIKDMIKPISLALVLLAINIALLILFYPRMFPPMIGTALDVGYIIATVWFFTALLTSYGTAIITHIASKSSDGFRKEVINLILKILYFIIVIVAILAILNNLGFNISALIASLGLGGLAVALAIKDTLANFFASVMLLFDNSFSQGDWIVCGNIEGTIVEMGLRRTTIRTFDNALLYIPNSILANDSIKNWNRRKVGRQIRLTIGVMYNSKIEALQGVIDDTYKYLLENDDIAKDEKQDITFNHYKLAMKKSIVNVSDLVGIKNTLYVHLAAFSASSIDIQVYCFSKTVNWLEFLKVKEDVLFEVMRIVDRHGLSFAFPSTSLYFEQELRVRSEQGASKEDGGQASGQANR